MSNVHQKELHINELEPHLKNWIDPSIQDLAFMAKGQVDHWWAERVRLNESEGIGGNIPLAAPIQPTNGIPDALIVLPQWVVWRFENRPQDGRPTKVLYATRGHRAASNRSATWATFDEVCAVIGNFDRLGRMFANFREVQRRAGLFIYREGGAMEDGIVQIGYATREGGYVLLASSRDRKVAAIVTQQILQELADISFGDEILDMLAREELAHLERILEGIGIPTLQAADQQPDPFRESGVDE